MNWLEHTVTVTVSLERIRVDDLTYEIPFFGESRPLEESIRCAGILNAPVVQEQYDRGMIPVLGRRRLKVAQDLGWAEIQVRSLPSSMPEQDGYELAFWDNCLRISDTATTAVVVNRLLELFSKEAVCSRFLHVLSVPPRGPRIERLCRVGRLERSILSAVATGRLLEKTAVILSHVNSADREILMSLVQDLRLNANTSDEVVAGLFDWAVVQQRSIGEILALNGFRKILEDADHPVPEKAARFRALLRSSRFPELDRREQEVREWVRECDLPRNVRIRHDHGFETGEYTIEVRASDRVRALKIIEALKNADT